MRLSDLVLLPTSLNFSTIWLVNATRIAFNNDTPNTCLTYYHSIQENTCSFYYACRFYRRCKYRYYILYLSNNNITTILYLGIVIYNGQMKNRAVMLDKDISKPRIRIFENLDKKKNRTLMEDCFTYQIL